MSLNLALILGGIATCLWIGYRAVTVDLRLKARVRRTPVCPIADLEDGQWARVVGRVVREGELLSAPLSGRECLYVHAWSEERTEGALVNGVPIVSWTDAGQSVNGCDFWVEDESGRLLVKLGGDFEPVPLFPPSCYERFEDRDHRGQEVTVCEGDTLAVLGIVTRTSTAFAGPFRSSDANALFLSGTSSAPVILTDLKPKQPPVG